MIENKPLISPEEIKNLIYTIRGKQVMIDDNLASLYQVETKNINKAVKRNIERFPVSFCFQLTEEEVLTMTEDGICPMFLQNKWLVWLLCIAVKISVKIT